MRAKPSSGHQRVSDAKCRVVYAPQVDEPATSSGCRLLDRDTFALDKAAGGGEGDDDKFLSWVVGERGTRDDVAAPWSLTSRSPWNLTRRDVGRRGVRLTGLSGSSATSPIPGRSHPRRHARHDPGRCRGRRRRSRRRSRGWWQFWHARGVGRRAVLNAP